jgi:AraC-like DNA-binding protein
MEASAIDAAGLGSLPLLFPGVRMVLRGSLEGARLSGRALGSARAFRVENVADRIERPLHRSDAASRFVKLVLQLRGEALVVHERRPVRLGAGDLTVLDGARAFSMELGGDYEQILFQLPREVVARRHERLFGLVGRELRGEAPAHAMVFETLCAMFGHLAALSEPHRAASMEAIVALLGALEPDDVEVSASRRRVRRALADLDAHLADPDLSADKLARLQSISRRRLDALFAEQGMSIGRLLWSRRLERVAADLQDPDKHGRRLLDIALSWGFSSEAHFSRAFRRRFGESPSGYRDRTRAMRSRAAR